MRLIIDIPKERYANIKEEQWMPNRLLIEKAIANGIPLEQIREEIEKRYNDSSIYVATGLAEALEIIDEYTDR